MPALRISIYVKSLMLNEVLSNYAQISLRKKYPYLELFWSLFYHIFPDWIRTRMTPNTGTFHAVIINFSLNIIVRSLNVSYFIIVATAFSSVIQNQPLLDKILWNKASG